MRYIILENESRFNLEESVESQIHLGYKPLGGVAAVFDNKTGLFGKMRYIQAMVKEVK